MAISVRTPGLLVVAAAMVLSTGCGSGDEPSSLRTSVLAHEKLIAECMHRHGFEYTVAVPPDVVAAEAREAAAKKGHDGLAAADEAMRNAPPNPNDTLLANLPPERQQAWGDALHGTATTPGCYIETYQAAWGVNPADAAARGEQHVARVKADPAVQAAERGYVECMVARGFDVKTTEDVFPQVAQQRESLDHASGEVLTRKAEAAHEACIGPYREVYDKAYLRLSPR